MKSDWIKVYTKNFNVLDCRENLTFCWFFCWSLFYMGLHSFFHLFSINNQISCSSLAIWSIWFNFNCSVTLMHTQCNVFLMRCICVVVVVVTVVRKSPVAKLRLRPNITHVILYTVMALILYGTCLQGISELTIHTIIYIYIYTFNKVQKVTKQLGFDWKSEHNLRVIYFTMETWPEGSMDHWKLRP